MHDIRLATTDDEIASTYNVMRQLRNHLAPHSYVDRVKILQKETGYLLAFVTEEETVRAVAGFRITASLAWGGYVSVDDLVSDRATRSSGYGSLLLEWVADYGEERGCVQLHLDSAVQRREADRFYLRRQADITCYQFQRLLNS